MLARELEAMQWRLEQSQARERELAEARRELVRWISHDLRTPLARIRAIVEALADRVLDDPAEIDARLGQLQLETKRLGALIADLFDLSTINAGELVMDCERTKIADVVSDVVASFSVIAAAGGLTLNAPPPAADLDIEASPTHLERALSNLLDNALRYTPPGGEITVGLASRAAGTRITVEDGCGGVDLGLLEQLIAEPNTRSRDGRTGRTGLGLAIAKGLIEAQGGRITVESAPHGCRFVIAFPAGTESRRGTDATAA